MTVRFIFIAVIVAASGALGAVLGQESEREIEKKRRLRESLKCTAMAMMHRKKSLCDALVEGAECGIYELKEIAQAIADAPYAPIGKRAAAMLERDKAFSGKSARDAARFIEWLSKTALAADIEAVLCDYLRETDPYLEEHGEKCRKRARLVRSLALMGGIAAAIIIV